MNPTPKFNQRVIFGHEILDENEMEAISQAEKIIKEKNLDLVFPKAYAKHPGFTREQIILRFVIGEAMNVQNAVVRMEKHDNYIKDVTQRGLSSKSMEYLVFCGLFRKKAIFTILEETNNIGQSFM